MSVSVGIGPNKLVAKVASDAEKPAGFVVLSREDACRRFAGRRPGSSPGSVRRPRPSSSGSASGRWAHWPGPATTCSSASSGRAWARGCAGARGSSPATTSRRSGSAVSESRETTFDTDLDDLDELEAILRRLAGELCAGLERNERRGRTIAIKVRLDDFATVTRARTIPRATNDTGEVAAIAVALLREYAPPRPVRLLGVRVAAFDAAAREIQLALEV